MIILSALFRFILRPLATSYSFVIPPPTGTDQVDKLIGTFISTSSKKTQKQVVKTKRATKYKIHSAKNLPQDTESDSSDSVQVIKVTNPLPPEYEKHSPLVKKLIQSMGDDDTAPTPPFAQNPFLTAEAYENLDNESDDDTIEVGKTMTSQDIAYAKFEKAEKDGDIIAIDWQTDFSCTSFFQTM